MSTWSSDTLMRDEQAEWLTRMGEKVINASRAHHGLPSSAQNGCMVLTVPTLRQMASVMNTGQARAPGSLMPETGIAFLD